MDMIGLLHSETFRKNLSKWIFMYIAVLCLLTSVITYSKFITSLGNEDEARTTMFNVKIEPLETATRCQDANQSDEGNPSSTAILCTTSRPTSLLEYYFKANVEEIEVKSEVYLRARAGDENYKTSTKQDSNLIIEDILLCTDETCTSFDDTKSVKVKAKSGSIKIEVDGTDKEKQNEYFFKVNAKYVFTKDNKDIDGYISFSSDDSDPISDEVRIGFSAIQVR